MINNKLVVGITKYSLYTNLNLFLKKIITKLGINIKKIKGLNDEKKLNLKDKKISILGDSISTFLGYSNDSHANNNIFSNKSFYPRSSSNVNNVNKTWWKKVINKTQMKLLVNNSSSGAHVYGPGNISKSKIDQGIKRVEYLKNNKGTEPDIIVIFIGVNDFNAKKELGLYSNDLFSKIKNGENYITPSNFTEAYTIMMDKLSILYPNSKKYSFTPLFNKNTLNSKTIEKYNDVIKKISDHYKINVVDMYNESGINSKNFNIYTSDGLHPNELGMDLIAKKFINELEKDFLN